MIFSEQIIYQVKDRLKQDFDAELMRRMKDFAVAGKNKEAYLNGISDLKKEFENQLKRLESLTQND